MATFALCAACDRAMPGAQASPGGAAQPTTAASDARRDLILLPDSAIVAAPGSLEAALAHYLASDAPAPRTFRFPGTEFAPWASRPRPATLRTMYALAQILRAYPDARVTLTGYTDDVGTDAQNLALARARAERLAALLERGGVRAGRITTEGRGAADFLADNATEAGRARNRRIELTIVAK